MQMKALVKHMDILILWYRLCYYWREFNFFQTKPKGVTTQMKARLDEYILMVLFVLLLKKVHCLVSSFASFRKKYSQ